MLKVCCYRRERSDDYRREKGDAIWEKERDANGGRGPAGAKEEDGWLVGGVYIFLQVFPFSPSVLFPFCAYVITRL